MIWQKAGKDNSDEANWQPEHEHHGTAENEQGENEASGVTICVDMNHLQHEQE